jgi:hypothetical protein
MKKMLLLMMCMPAVLAAQNGVTLSGLNVNSGTMTFDVSWNKATMPLVVWLDSVWVFVDYNDAGVMKRLPLKSGATLTTTSAPGVGRVIQYSDNDKGVWVVGNAKSEGNSSGSFSATVKLLTATATGACVYASNYPPVAEYLTAQTIKFTGTPPYDLVLSSGTTTAYSDYNLLTGQTLVSFTDKTGVPGIIKNKNVTPPLAASTRTWVITGNGITQTWSDRINSPTDCNKSDFTTSTTDPSCRSLTYNNTLYYYYNWPYLDVNNQKLCPSSGGWRLPTGADIVNLDLAFGGTGVCRNTASSAWIIANYRDAWGGRTCQPCVVRPFGTITTTIIGLTSMA